MMGVLDDIDLCPATPVGTAVGSIGCAIPSIPLDTDNDGVFDNIDVCPATPAGTGVDSVGCAIVLDSDGDGVFDDLDLCADIPQGDTVNTDGCSEVLPIGADEVTSSNGKLVGGVDTSLAGFTLYVFDNDQSSPLSSNCNGAFAVNWPPLLMTDSEPRGVNYLGTIDRNDGSKQITYQTRPLYFYQGDTAVGQVNGDNIANWHSVDYQNISSITALYDDSTVLVPMVSFVRDDGVVVTRVGDRGRDRHAKDITSSDHYDHYLAHYWQYRTARIQLEDFVPNGESRIRATFITEAELGAREFRVWFWGRTTGQFHFNPQKEESKVSQLETGVKYLGRGTWNDNFEKTSEQGHQFKYELDIVNQWKNGGQQQPDLVVGTNMEFEISLFLLNLPAGARLNYYGTSFVYVIGQPGLAPFEWQRGVDYDGGGSNDGTPIPESGLLGGDTTLGYN
jgi:predicted lipoprotein with Yx(FWY)xxD motif